LGGRIAATIYPIGTALPHVQSGAIRALATTGAQRSQQLPDVPTVSEAGYPILQANEWFGVFVPANTPVGTVNHLNEAIRTVVNTSAFKAALAKLSVDPAGETPEEFSQLVKSDFERWGPIVKASGSRQKTEAGHGYPDDQHIGNERNERGNESAPDT